MQKQSKKPIWTKSELREWSLPKDITVSTWADQNRYLDPMTSAEPGRWRTERTPYLREIMDAFKLPQVETVTLMMSTQVGKTETLFNCLAYAIDQDPGPTLYVMPTELQAKTIGADRLHPMINCSISLHSHRTPYEDDFQKLYMKLDRMIIYLAGSNSPSSLASKPVRYLFMDEVDKYPKFSGDESSPIDLAEERTRTFWNRRIVKCSTPTTRDGYIFNEYQKTNRMKYHVPCPHCGEFQILLFPQIKWPEEEANADDIQKNKSAWYECQFCKGKITDANKNGMLLKGKWLTDEEKIDKNGVFEPKNRNTRHVGFWMNCLYSPWLTFSDIASKFLKSKDYPEKLMNFVNSWLAEVWEEKIHESKPDQLKRHRQAYQSGIVPDGCYLLTGGVDVQKDHFYFTIRGWGLSWESWLVLNMRVETWDDVVHHLFKTHYPGESGGEFPVILTLIDSGYNADEVYEVVRNWPDIARASKGRDALSGVPFKMNVVERYPGTNKPIPGGIQLWHLDTNYFKNKIHRWMSFDENEITKWHLPENVSEDYLKQLCSERKIIERDRNGKAHEVWTLSQGHAANHYLDAEVYATAAAEMMRVYALTKQDSPRVFVPENAHGHKDSQQKPHWLRNTRGWINGKV